jgi:hypothetical protein
VKRQNKKARLTKIESSPARYPRLSPLSYGKPVAKFLTNLNSERESRQNRNTHGLSHNQLPALDLRTGCITTTLSYSCRPFRNGLISVIIIGHRHESA